MKKGLFFLTFILLFLYVSCDVQISSVTRNIDLSSQLARHTITINLQNSGSAASSFDLSLEASAAQRLSYITATLDGTLTNISAGAARNSPRGEGHVVYTINFPRPLQGSAALVANLVFTHSLEPYPATVSQDENQFLRYTDSVYLYSSYKIPTQTTTIKLASSKVESHTDVPPVRVRGSSVTYGPYTDIPTFTSKPFTLHFLSNKALLTVTKLVREIEISHWGNVAVEETYNLEHSGAKLTGHFSRYDYQRNQQGAQTVVRSIHQILPLYAQDLYYRDDIGNISTSHITANNRSLILELIPRFPLFGGWKTEFYMGYNARLNTALGYEYNSGKYVLNITVLPQYEEELVYDDVEVRVIVPEGASGLELRAPFAVDAQNIDKRLTYLDTSGRPVLVFNKRNMVSDHVQYFQVAYSFTSTSVFHEPILLIASYFAFFLIIIVGVRLSLRIESN
eukprot:TRINITY_DN491_c0_g1_i1.p1 TRINITY_DN491_c0_g1~~TRINITY_DN491_c0_g1_i1.p1  ORF type:complete len:452 (+),score=84.22 TRINITY_DN491_c0_g1_i1:93-1448(+)